MPKIDRKFKEDKIVLGSHNKGKLVEIQAYFNEFFNDNKEIEIISAFDLDISDPDETKNSFIGNAEEKALYYARQSNLPAISDDSGLCIDALNGMPGIYSARWAGPNKDFNYAMKRIEEYMQNEPKIDNTAYFVCALALAWPNGDVVSVEGRVYGKIKFPPKGDKGFGYDPIFFANRHTQNFAQIDPEAKHSISHRSDAFKKLFKSYF